MKCDKARELILTDYMDSGTDARILHEVDEHLLRCASCREFHELAREKITRQFAPARDEDPPEFIWKSIREKIESGPDVKSGILSALAESIRPAFSRLLSIPRPVVALAAGAMIIILVMVAAPGIRRRALDEYLNEQIAFIAKLDGPVESNGTGIFDTEVQIGSDDLL